jgi:hypothetical protein
LQLSRAGDGTKIFFDYKIYKLQSCLHCNL